MECHHEQLVVHHEDRIPEMMLELLVGPVGIGADEVDILSRTAGGFQPTTHIPQSRHSAKRRYRGKGCQAHPCLPGVSGTPGS